MLIVGGALILRSLFPKTITVASPPRITTRYDTVRVIDTLRLRREVIHTRADTIYLERFTVSIPETVRVAPRLVGMTQLVVAPFVGDSTVAQGFRLAPTDSGYAVSQWEAQFYTPGPLRALALVDGKPVASFGPPPPKACRFFCKAGHYALGGLVGFTAAKVF